MIQHKPISSKQQKYIFWGYRVMISNTQVKYKNLNDWDNWSYCEQYDHHGRNTEYTYLIFAIKIVYYDTDDDFPGMKFNRMWIPRDKHCKCIWNSLNYWGRVRHKCVSNVTIIGSDNGFSPGWCQAIIWTSIGILLIGTIRTNCSEILLEIHIFSFRKMRLKRSSAKWWPFLPGP